MCEGFPTRWTQHKIVPILKSGDPMMLGNYRTIMIDHYLAKLFGLYFRIRIEYMGRVEWPTFSWTGRLSEGVHNFGSHIDHPGPY